MSFEETIVATASASGPAFRGVIRLSGPAAFRALQQAGVCVPGSASVRSALTCSLTPWSFDRSIPAKIFIWPQGEGYTGEESVEIHTIGSPPILDAIVSALCRTEGVRLARPGEFTMRAFLAGRIDLTKAEAVLGVIDAQSDRVLETALNQLAGGVASPIRELRELLFETLAHLEAGLDFVEEDIEFISLDEVRRILYNVKSRLAELQHRTSTRGLSNEKPIIVLIGPPNSGKSTLFNVLSGGNHAIISPMAGTTRDYLEAEVSFEGISCKIIDTAGLDASHQQSHSTIDIAAQDFSQESFRRADVVLYCTETKNDSPSDERTIRIRTKSDLVPNVPVKPEEDVIHVSSKTGFGLDELHRRIGEKLSDLFSGGDILPCTAQRCGESLQSTVTVLDRALELLSTTDTIFDESLLASEIRHATNSLGLIDGTVHTEDLLDRVFARFCIGK